MTEYHLYAQLPSGTEIKWGKIALDTAGNILGHKFNGDFEFTMNAHPDAKLFVPLTLITDAGILIYDRTRDLWKTTHDSLVYESHTLMGALCCLPDNYKPLNFEIHEDH